MASLINTLTSYVPQLLVKDINQATTPLTQAKQHQVLAAVLFADISGFTAITEKFSQQGAAGTEAITQLLNTYFSELITLVTASGGDIITFAGDSLVAVWTIDHQAEMPKGVLQASQCALAIQHQLHAYQTAHAINLSLRLAIGAGLITIRYLGGVNNRWHHLISGPPLINIGRIEALAQPGTVLLTPNAWQHVHPFITTTPLTATTPPKAYQLHTVDHPPPFSPLKPIHLPADKVNLLKPHIAPIIIERHQIGQTSWLAELRPITSLFINLPAFNDDIPLTLAQKGIHTLQTILYRFDGRINKLTVDDKGISVVAAFGLPPQSHDNDPRRGVQAALSIFDAFSNLDLDITIGISSGQAFCGLIGNEQRREYTMIGQVINLAARLMQAAQIPDYNPILCDHATWKAATQQILYDDLPPLRLKGIPTPVPVYRPTSMGITTNSSAPPLIGREEEQQLFNQTLQQLQQTQQNNTLIIEGEAGIGKSHLLEQWQRQAQEQNLPFFLGTADAIEKSTPYHPWRTILAQIFDIDLRRHSTPNQIHTITTFVQHNLPHTEPLLPLLNTILPVDFPETELTRQMSGDIRAHNLNDFIHQLLAWQAAKTPFVLAIEDAHWLDSASWLLLKQLNRHIKPLLLILVTRPFGPTPPTEYLHLLQQPSTQLIPLDILPHHNIITIVCSRLGVSSLPAPVEKIIQEKAEGHPFFSEEIAYALRDRGIIYIENGHCRIAPHIRDLTQLDFPTTIQGVITSRIDQLTPQQILVLKVASVIGRVFHFLPLQAIHPIEQDKPHLKEYLTALNHLDITPIETPDPNLAYIFKHIITQEVAYNLMSFSQRKQLHQITAQWLESYYAQDLTSWYPLLAHHWQKAEIQEKAIFYLNLAGAQALHDGAYQEAVHFLQKAIDLEKEQPANTAQSKEDAIRRGYIQNNLGHAYLGLGDVVNSRHYLTTALQSLGFTLPQTTGQTAVTILQQLARQIRNRLRQPQPDTPNRDILLTAAVAYERLAELAFLRNDIATTATGTLYSLNLAEAAGPSSELARGYANVAIAAGVSGLHPLARTYIARATDVLISLDSLPARSWTLTLIAIYHSSLSDFATANPLYQEAINLCQEIGDKRVFGIAISALGFNYLHQNKFDLVQQTTDDLLTIAHQRDDHLQLCWAHLNHIEILLHHGHLDKAAQLHTTATDLLVANEDVASTRRLKGIKLWLAIHKNELDYAQQLAANILTATQSGTPTSYSTYTAYTSPAAAYLHLWQAQQTLPPQQQQKAKQACRLLRQFARAFPFGRPRSLLYDGWLAHHLGHHRRAHKKWSQSLSLAQQYNLPHEIKLAQDLIARLNP
ncbi:MAG TPA: adenylate/guanylate cyclase domain-containing protein [Anaerolineae bacterium]|nr:adenylate/guanylate cyclase domain-containing protein [Anaerolineae bacterium]